MFRNISIVVVGFVLSEAWASPSSRRLSKRATNETDMVYSFEDVPTSTDLQWTPCYDKFKCANLEVPLDYAEPSVGNTTVAFIRLDAGNGTGQDILFNPGGPAGSGIATAFSSIPDEFIERAGGRYNFVTFDPRGVNNSEIDLTCYPGDPDSRGSAEIDSNGSPYEQYSMAVAMGQWCTKANNDTLAKYAGTSAVVQDMLHFTSLQAAQNGDQNADEAQVWYYGVSYGTVIGHTLAALYPNRVGRVVVDGNVNSEEYYLGYSTRELEDTDKGFDWFFSLCAEVGPEVCKFAMNSSTVGDVKARFDTLLAKLDLTPVVSTDKAPMIVTTKALLTTIFNMLYIPVQRFPVLAEILAGLEQDNATAWVHFKTQQAASVQGPFNYTEVSEGEAMTLIRAIDASGRSVIKSADDHIRQTNKLQYLSAYDGLVLAAPEVLSSVAMEIMPPNSQYFQGFNETEPATPVLFLNSVADPITPVGSAMHMAQFFKDSVVLLQNSTGHSTMAIPSSCISEHLIAYLDNGTMPSEGTICQPDTQPFEKEPEK